MVPVCSSGSGARTTRRSCCILSAWTWAVRRLANLGDNAVRYGGSARIAVEDSEAMLVIRVSSRHRARIARLHGELFAVI